MLGEDTGEVFGRCSRRRKASDLLRFTEDVAVRFPHKRITIIWDNVNTHAEGNWRAFNDRHGRPVQLRYTPIHASWVNQVEIWFSILARRVLRYGSFTSVAELTAAVRGFIAEWNDHEAPRFAGPFADAFAATRPEYDRARARFVVEEHRTADVLEHLAQYEGLPYVRARAEARRPHHARVGPER